MIKDSKKSLEKLASPEQLDRLLVIIRLPGWVALLCILLILIGILLWSLFGWIPVTVNGKGIFFDPESIMLIQSDDTGIIGKVYVNAGGIVKKNDLLLTIKDPRKRLEKQQLIEKIRLAEDESALEKKNVGIALEQNRAIYALQKRRLEELKADKAEERYALEVEMKKQEEIIALLENQVPEEGWKLTELKQQLKNLEERIDDLNVRAPANGTVLAVKILVGEEVTVGKNLFWFQKTENRTDKEKIYGFFPLKKGDQIKTGMFAHIVFNTVDPQLYGKMEGVVKEILPFAVSQQAEVLQSIPSETLREYLLSDQAAIMVVIEPIRSPATPSGFKWTTQEGPPFPLHADLIAEVEVFLERKRPISYLIPIGHTRE